MKKFFQYFGIFSLLLFSFYYINEINNVIIYQSDLMNQIKESKNVYEIDSVNAFIEENTIIPGINGKEVNVLESYYNMRTINVFNPHFLVYDEVLPVYSVNDYKNRYIIKGNSLKRNIALVIDDNSYIEKYLMNNNYKISKLITYEEYKEDSYFEQINNDIKNYSRLSSKLDSNICVVNNNNLELCKKAENYLIKIETILTNDNIYLVKENLYSGQIIKISNTLSLENFQVLLREILFKNYNIVTLSEIIKE